MPQKYAIFASKAETLALASFSGRPYPILVVKKVKLTPEQYDDLAGDLQKARPWMAVINTKTGTKVGDTSLIGVIEIACRGRKTFYIDPEGTSYANLVGVAW